MANATPQPAPQAIPPNRAFAAAGIGFVVAMVDGYDTLMLAFIAPLIAKEWSLLPQTIGALFASSYAGAALGATVIGIGADRFGRKAMLLASLSLVGVFTVLCARSADPVQLMAFRAIAGLGLGGALSTITALTAESAPAERRRATVTRMFLGFPVGAIVGGAATAAAMSYLGWRGVFVGGGVCALLLLPIVAIGVSESPRETGVAARMHSRRPFADMVSGGPARDTMLFGLCVFLMLLTSYFLVSWIPTVLTLNGMSPRHAAMGAVLLNGGGIVGSLILSFILDRKNPLRPIAASLAAGAILIALLGYAMPSAGDSTFILVFVVGLAIIGAQGGIPALCVYLYPRSAYATAVGLSVACARLGSIVGPLVGGYLVSARLGWSRLFLLAALPALSASLVMWTLAAVRRGDDGRP
jgi:AAHS family 4-hydroxybenzoate transporter-like MFS transporter